MPEPWMLPAAGAAAMMLIIVAGVTIFFSRKMTVLRVESASLAAMNSTLTERVGELKDEASGLTLALDQERAAAVTHREQITRLRTTLSEQQNQTEEKLKLLTEARGQLDDAFRNLATEIFEAKQKDFKAQNKEQLGALLNPLGERIRDFEKRVEETYSNESKERFSLVKEVKALQELNGRIAQDAVNLTNALKGENKTQGNWGEVVLERVLEESGLQKGREYETQVSLANEDGKRLQPDVIVHLPEGKDVIIDSKVTLTAYERFCSTDDADEQAKALKAHVQSLRTHVKQLSAKDYQKLKGLRTLDFVLLFVPVEAAFTAAVQEDPAIYSDAFSRNIMIVSPSTLLTTLRTIQNIWRYEQQNKNAQEIASKAGALYDKFVSFVSDLDTVGARLESTQNAYRDAYSKLASGKGNLVRRAEDMKDLGAKVSKSLPKNLVEMPQRELPLTQNVGTGKQSTPS